MCNFQIMKIMKKVKKCQKSPNYCKKTLKYVFFSSNIKERKSHTLGLWHFLKKNFFLKKNPDQCDFLTQYKGEKNTYIKVIS